MKTISLQFKTNPTPTCIARIVSQTSQRKLPKRQCAAVLKVGGWIMGINAHSLGSLVRSSDSLVTRISEFNHNKYTEACTALRI